jgi:hypothetical protein
VNWVLCRLWSPRLPLHANRTSASLLDCFTPAFRFGLAHRLLCNLFGSVGAAPPNTALLWLALALDTDSRRQAERLIFELIEKCQPSGPDGSANGECSLAAPHSHNITQDLRMISQSNPCCMRTFTLSSLAPLALFPIRLVPTAISGAAAPLHPRSAAARDARACR